MPRRVEVHAGTRYTIAEDGTAPMDLLPWAVLRTRVIDELTLAPPLTRVSLVSTLRGARAKIADSGVCGLVARPRDVAGDLVRPNGFTAEVTAPGYLSRDLTPAIEAARRTLTTAAAAQMLDVLPADPLGEQFSPGRGVIIERIAPPAVDQEQFTTVVPTSPPPIATDVPLADTVAPARPGATRVTGVPMVLPDQRLHRDASLRIRGRVQRRTGPATLVPAVGADVGILGIWLDYPSSVTGAPASPDFCYIEPALRRPHPIGATVHTCGLNAVGPVRQLQRFAPSGSTEIVVTPNVGLNPAGGDLLRLGNPLDGTDEVVVTRSFPASTNGALPVRIRLRTPTGRLHREGDPSRDVQVVSLTAVGAVSRECLPGDPVLFAPGLAALAGPSTVIVENATPQATFYQATPLPTTNAGVFTNTVALDATGRFEWPPLARVAQIRIVATLLAQTVQRDVALDYGGDAAISIVLT